MGKYTKRKTPKLFRKNLRADIYNKHIIHILLDILYYYIDTYGIYKYYTYIIIYFCEDYIKNQ